MQTQLVTSEVLPSLALGSLIAKEKRGTPDWKDKPSDWSDIRLDCPANSIALYAGESGTNYVIENGVLTWANPNIYLQSSGTQYIDTGLQGVTDFELDVQGVETSGSSQVVISRNSPDGNFFGQFGSSGKYGCGTGNTLSVSYTTRYKFPIHFTETGISYEYEGTTYTQNGTAYLENNFYLYRSNSSGWYAAKAKIFSCKAYQNGTLVQHLVPVPSGLVIGDYTVPSNGLFDIVTQTFFENKGTGTFTYSKITPDYDNLGFTATCTGSQYLTTQEVDIAANKGWTIVGGINPAIVSGATSISLPNAVADTLQYLKAFGGCSQATTPTPSDPVDIVCNNGTIKVKHQSGLPTGYKLVEYLTSTKAIDLGINTTQDTELEAKWLRSGNGAQYVYASDSGAALTTNTTAYISSTGNWRFGAKTVTLTFSSDAIHTTIQNKTGVTENGVTLGTYTGIQDFTSVNTLKIFGVDANASIRLYSLKIRTYESDTNSYYYLPCVRESDNAVGVYDIINGQFYTNDEATITAGNDVSDPIEIYVEGTKETITDSLSHTVTCEDLFGVPNVSDEQEILTGSISKKIDVKIFDGSETFGTSSAYGAALYIQSAAGTWKADKTKIPLCTHFLGISTPAGTQNESTCFFNASGHLYFRTSENAANFKTFLKALYDAGTPMMLVYASSNPTTETVTGQTMQVKSGSNTIQITQAAINGLTLEAKYYKEN